MGPVFAADRKGCLIEEIFGAVTVRDAKASTPFHDDRSKYVTARR